VRLRAERVMPRRGEFIHVMLSEDHAHLERLLQELVARVRQGDRATLRGDWQRFERELTSHMELEEQEILPSFQREHPAEARAIRDEHARIRAGLTEMGIDLDLHCLRAERVEAFIELLRAHARREEALFYPWASHTTA
jgi:hemerythrin-like domain-containing protein